MKKLFVIAILTASLAACGGKKNGATAPTNAGDTEETTPADGTAGGATYGAPAGDGADDSSADGAADPAAE